jgi:hypothetical protein
MTENKYKIKSIQTEKSKTPLRTCMKDSIMPRFPFSMMISGRSGSGKTNCLINILTNEHLLKDYFHYIVVFSPTAGKYDDSYKALKLPPENFKTKFAPEDLNNLIESRKKLIEKKNIEWVVKNSRVLIILDDVIASPQFLESAEALTMFALLRHYQISVIVLMQTYNRLPKTLRNNCNALIVFPSNQSEVEVLLDEITPANMLKKEFKKVIDHCCSERYSFLYINNHAEPGKKIRRNLDEIIDLESFKDRR